MSRLNESIVEWFKGTLTYGPLRLITSGMGEELLFPPKAPRECLHQVWRN